MLVPGVGVEPTRCVAPKDFKSVGRASTASTGVHLSITYEVHRLKSSTEVATNPGAWLPAWLPSPIHLRVYMRNFPSPTVSRADSSSAVNKSCTATGSSVAAKRAARRSGSARRRSRTHR